VWKGVVLAGAGLLQRELQHLRAAGRALFSRRLQLGIGPREHAVRYDDLQYRLRVLQLELQHLRAIRRHLRQETL
jgi:hypothetical protein